MKQFILILTLAFLSVHTNAQDKNFIDQPYIEVSATFDSSFSPDEIYLAITISEADTKNKISLEQLENDMVNSFKKLGVNIDKDLKVTDIQSNIKKYVLKQKDVMKSRSYELKVNNAVSAAKIFIALEKLGIGNANIDHVDNSKLKEVENTCYARAMVVARQKAELMANALGSAIGQVLYITDNGNEYIGGYEKTRMVKFTMPTIAKDEEISPANIEFEKMQISRNVLVRFKLK